MVVKGFENLQVFSLTKQNFARFLYFISLILLVVSAYYTYEDALAKNDENTKIASFAFMIVCIIWASVQLRNLTYRFLGGNDRFWVGIIILFNILFIALYCIVIYFGNESSYYTKDEPWFYVFCIAGFFVLFFTVIELFITPEWQLANTIKDNSTAHFDFLKKTTAKDYALKQIYSAVQEQNLNFSKDKTNKNKINIYSSISKHIKDVFNEGNEKKKDNLIRYLSTKIDDKTSFALNNIPTADGPFRWENDLNGAKDKKIATTKPISLSETYRIIDEMKNDKNISIPMFSYGKGVASSKNTDRNDKNKDVKSYGWGELISVYKNEVANDYVENWLDDIKYSKTNRENSRFAVALKSPKEKINYKCGLLSFSPVIAINENVDIVKGTKC